MYSADLRTNNGQITSRCGRIQPDTNQANATFKVYISNNDTQSKIERKSGELKDGHDVHFVPGASLTAHVVNIGDLLFTKRTHQAPRRQIPGDVETPVFAAANGVSHIECSDIAFVGVSAADTPLSGTHDERFTANVHGVVTAINFGRQTINCGDMVMWKFPGLVGHSTSKPYVLAKGYDVNRVHFETCSVETMSVESFGREYAHIFNPEEKKSFLERHEIDTTNKPLHNLFETVHAHDEPTQTAIQRVIRNIALHNRALESRIIGKALSRSKPGDNLTLFIG